MLRLKSLPTGDVEFIDLGDVSTPEGRTDAINNASKNAQKTFQTMLDNPEIDKQFDEENKKVIKDVQAGFDKLTKLEADKAKVMKNMKKPLSDTDKAEIQKLQEEFSGEAMKILIITKTKSRRSSKNS